MKKLLLSAVFLSATSAFAAPNPTIDLLQLPPQNRRMALRDLSADQFQRLSELAFSDAQPMRLRWAAVVSLAQARPQEALPLLLKASRDGKWFMRNAALVALAETHPLQAEAVAKRLMKDKALVIRSAAVDVLAKYPSAENRDLLWSELDASYNFHHGASLWIRSQIVGQLARKPQDQEMKFFARLLRDKDPRVHLASIQGLEKITGVRLGDEKTTPPQKLSLWQDYIKKEGTF